MFTGIVQAVGRIASATPHGDGLRIAVEAAALGVDGVKAGDSIAVAGCCLTVVAVERDRLCFDVSAETLSCTTGLDRTGRVNLEPALRLSDRLGGHLVSGHVDGIGSVIRAEVVGAADGSRVLGRRRRRQPDRQHRGAAALCGESDPAYTDGNDTA